MKRFFTLAMGVTLLSLTSAAYTPEQQVRLFPNPKGVSLPTKAILDKSIKTVEDANGVINNVLSQTETPFITKAKSSAEESAISEDCYEVKCHMLYDPEQFRPIKVVGYNVSNYDNDYWDWSSDYMSLTLNPGTYDFLMTFNHLNQESIWGTMGESLVIIEDVEVKEDMTLDFDPTTANVCLQFNPTLRNGEPVSIYTMRYDENWNIEVLDEGNSGGVFLAKKIIVDGIGAVYSLMTNTTVNIVPGYTGMSNTDWFQNWYVTPVSDKYQFVNLSLIDTQMNPFELCMLSCRGTNHEEVITNDSSLFYPELSVDFESAPLSAESPDISNFPYEIRFGLFDSGAVQGFLGVGCMDKFAHTLYYCPDTQDVEGQYPRVQFDQVEYTEVIKESFEIEDEIYEYEYEQNYSTETPWFNFVDGSAIVNIANESYLDRDEEGYTIFVNNDATSFDWQDSRLKFGGSAPYGVLSLAEIGWEGEPEQTYLKFEYFGQMGENKWLPANYNGCTVEMVDDNPRHLLINAYNDNLSVGPMQGNINVYADFNLSESSNIPVITGMQCRTSEGIINDTFDKGKDGRLLVTAGAFEQRNLGYNDWGYTLFVQDYSEGEVKVEYCAHGTGDFEILEGEALSTEPQLPGIGQLYTYDLGQVSQVSSTGWFDARITVTADGGNVQTQTISPLFCINEATGIAAVERVESPEYYNLQGIRVENPTNGIYIVKRGNSTSKQYIR